MLRSASTNDLGKDVVRLCSPDVRPGGIVVLFDGPQDCTLEFLHAPEHASPNVVLRDVPEIPLDHVQPGGSSRNEVDVETRVLGQPFLHFRMFVGPVVVANDVQLQALGSLALDPPEKP